MFDAPPSQERNPFVIPLLQKKRKDVPRHVEDSAEADVTDEAELISALNETLTDAGYPFDKSFVAMLTEHAPHRDASERHDYYLGSGFAEFGWALSEIINRPRSQNGDDELTQLFGDALYKKRAPLIDALDDRVGPTTDYRAMQEEEQGIRRHVRAEARAAITQALHSVASGAEALYARMLVELIHGEAIKHKKDISVPEIQMTSTRDQSMKASKATELPFLEYTYGLVGKPSAESQRIVDGSLARFDTFNYILDEAGAPIMVETKGIGDDHACLTLYPVYMNGVHIPSGSLMNVVYDKKKLKHTEKGKEGTISFEDCTFEFSRLSTLAVEPSDRSKSFGGLLAFQRRNGMPHAADARLADVRRGAERRDWAMRLRMLWKDKSPKAIQKMIDEHLKKRAELKTQDERELWEIQLDVMQSLGR